MLHCPEMLTAATPAVAARNLGPFANRAKSPIEPGPAGAGREGNGAGAGATFGDAHVHSLPCGPPALRGPLDLRAPKRRRRDPGGQGTQQACLVLSIADCAA